MWIKSENSDAVKPIQLEPSVSGMIVRRDFHFVEADEEMPAHWQYEEWQMTTAQYEVWEVQQADVDFLTMENEYLTDQQEIDRADIDYLLMITEE